MKNYAHDWHEYCQDQLELHRPGVRFAKLRVVRPLKSYCVTAEHVDTPNLS